MFLTNPLGMGAGDFIELALAALLLAFALAWRPWWEPYAARLAQRPLWCVLLLAALPVALRLLLLPRHPAPVPDIYDEFSHLLVADTLRHHYRRHQHAHGRYTARQDREGRHRHVHSGRRLRSGRLPKDRRRPRHQFRLQERHP